MEFIDPCVIHCPENSTAHCFAKKFHIPFDFDYNAEHNNNSKIVIPKETASNQKKHKYVFISFAKDSEPYVQKIIRKLSEHECEIVSSQSLSVDQKLDSFIKSTCIITFISHEYINSNEIQYLRLAIDCKKTNLVYILDNSKIPDDISLSSCCEQKLIYNSGTETDRYNKLINWIVKNGCCKKTVKLPDYDYSATKNGITLKKYTGNGVDICIPADYGNYPIIAIGDKTFFRCNRITNIIIPNSVISIGSHAFCGCSNLTSVIIPNSVTIIGEKAFYDCCGLMSITLPDSVAMIGKSAFGNCSNFTSVTIPEGIKTIESYAFSGCSSLTSVIIPDSVTSIEWGVFMGCSSLTSVIIPDSVTRIESDAFKGCSSLTSLIMPDSVTSIDSSAFEGCSNLTSVKIPDSVTRIYSKAFKGCSSLTTLIMPDSVTRIDPSAFEGCSSLTICCSQNSFTWKYCQKHRIKYKTIE